MAEAQGVPYQPIPIVAETIPYAPPPVTGQPMVVALLRRWHRHWICICGDVDYKGIVSCLLGWFVPCVAFGINKRRAFTQSAFLWALIFFILLLLSPVCPSKEEDNTMNVKFRGFEFCGSNILNKGIAPQAVVAITFVAGVALIIMGAINRQELRSKFGLEGNSCTDCLLWAFCQPCALAQETRTLWYNRVEDGVWRGPPRVYVPPAGDYLQVPGTPVQGPTMTVAVCPSPVTPPPSVQPSLGYPSTPESNQPSGPYPPALPTV
eukprot:evm.model.scf_823.6 EVM.evm.TU.scf_823.6   scf_823:28944-30618(-)